MKLNLGKQKKSIKVKVFFKYKQNKQIFSQTNQRERELITKIRNEKGYNRYRIKQRITKNYHKQQYTNKLDNLEETDKFLEIYNLLFHRETENLNRTIMTKKVESVIKNLPIKQTSRTRWFHW